MTGTARRREWETLMETVRKTWAEEMMEAGEARGELRNCRENLCLLLEDRFGPLPPALLARIGAVEDLERLRAALRQTVRLSSLDDLVL